MKDSRKWTFLDDEEHGPLRLRVTVAEDACVAYLLKRAFAPCRLCRVMVEGYGKLTVAEAPLAMERLPSIAHKVLPAACGAQLHLYIILVRAHIEALVCHRN